MGQFDRGTRRSGVADDQIQFVAPRSGVFGAGESTDAAADLGPPRAAFDDERPASRWSTIGATIGLAGLISVGIVAAAPWNDPNRNAAPATSTSTTGTTTTGTTTTGTTTTAPVLPPLSVAAATAGSPLPTASVVAPPFDGTPAGSPGMLYGAGEAPDGFSLVGASSFIDAVRQPGEGSGWFELWGTPGASRTNGSWFAVTVQPGRYQATMRNAERIQVGPVIGLRSISTDGVRMVQFPLGADSIAITSWGWADEALVDLAASLSLHNGRPVFGDTSFQSDHRLLVARQSDQGDLDGQLFATLVSIVMYRRETDQQLLTILNAAVDTDTETVMPFVVAPIPGAVTSGPNTFFVVAGRAVMFASLPGRDDQTIARWTENGVTVELLTTMSIAEVIALVPGIRLGTQADWALAESRADGGLRNVGDAIETDAPSTANGALAGGSPWSVRLAADGAGAMFATSNTTTNTTSSSSNEQFFDVLGNDAIVSFATLTATFVVSVIPADRAPSAMHLDGPEGPLDVPYLPVVTNTGIATVAAIHAFDQLGPFTASVAMPKSAAQFTLSVGTA